MSPMRWCAELVCRIGIRPGTEKSAPFHLIFLFQLDFFTFVVVLFVELKIWWCIVICDASWSEFDLSTHPVVWLFTLLKFLLSEEITLRLWELNVFILSVIWSEGEKFFWKIKFIFSVQFLRKHSIEINSYLSLDFLTWNYPI